MSILNKNYPSLTKLNEEGFEIEWGINEKNSSITPNYPSNLNLYKKNKKIGYALKLCTPVNNEDKFYLEYRLTTQPPKGLVYLESLFSSIPNILLNLFQINPYEDDLQKGYIALTKEEKKLKLPKKYHLSLTNFL